ncbi:hypothetical protein MKW98_005885, partial [Papaver atlanticum]
GFCNRWNCRFVYLPLDLARTKPAYQVCLFLILWILFLWELDIAIVRATDHVERPTKEKHIRATRSRADVAYCTHALSRRLVAMKILTVIHRALREVDHSFREELINYGRSRRHMLNMAHFKDDSSPNA